MLNKAYMQLIREQEVEISRQSIHGIRQRNKLSCYRNSIEAIPSVLKKNTCYEQLESVVRIQADLQRHLELTKQGRTISDTD